MNNSERSAFNGDNQQLKEKIGKGISESEYFDRTLGLTKREYFAALAMQGLLSNSHYVAKLEELFKHNQIDINVMLCRESVDMSEELLKQLELMK